MALWTGESVPLIGSESAPVLHVVAQTLAVLAGATAIVVGLYFCGRWLSRRTNV